MMNRMNAMTLSLCIIGILLYSSESTAQIGIIWETESPCNAFLGSANMDDDQNEELVYYNTEPDQIIIYDGLTGLPEWTSGLWEYIGIAGWSSSSATGSAGWLGNSPFCDTDNDGKMEITFRGQVNLASPYKIYVVGLGGTGLTASGGDAQPGIQILSQNYPNPFNPSTTIQYSLTSPGAVSIRIYNTLGQEVRTVVNEFKPPGEYTVNWDGKDQSGNFVSSGTYFYQMQVGDYVTAKKAILLK